MGFEEFKEFDGFQDAVGKSPVLVEQAGQHEHVRCWNSVHHDERERTVIVDMIFHYVPPESGLGIP